MWENLGKSAINGGSSIVRLAYQRVESAVFHLNGVSTTSNIPTGAELGFFRSKGSPYSASDRGKLMDPNLNLVGPYAADMSLPHIATCG